MSTQQEKKNAEVARNAFGSYFAEVGPEKFVELYAPDAVVYEYGLPGSPVMRGREQLLGFLTQMANSFPEARYEPQMVLPSGNHVVVVWRWQGTLNNDFLGVKADGQSIDLPGIMIYEFQEDGLIKSERVWWNFLELLTQLDALPPGFNLPAGPQ